jgi:hypothetical protein
MWDNERDCNMQLSGTIVRKGKFPVYVEEVRNRGEGLTAEYRVLSSGRTGRCLVADLDIKPVPLGYVNTGGRALYTSRMPRRRWKAGLDEGNIIARRNTGAKSGFNPRLAARSTAACIQGRYPSFLEARTRCQDEGGEVAFSRKFCVLSREEGPLALYYKTKPVGDVTREGDAQLRQEYTYLTQALEAATHGVE